MRKMPALYVQKKQEEMLRKIRPMKVPLGDSYGEHRAQMPAKLPVLPTIPQSILLDSPLLLLYLLLEHYSCTLFLIITKFCQI
jgi:hypothetical protein